MMIKYIFFGLAAVLLFFLYQSSFILNVKDQPSCKVKPVPKSVRVLYLNLERATERRASIEPLIKELGYVYERINAVDGKTLSQEDILKHVDLEKFKQFRGRPPKAGEIGCSMSHYYALKKFLESSEDVALILEDDVTFNPKELRLIIEEALQHQAAWDTLTFQSNHHGFPVTVKKLDRNAKIVQYFMHVAESGAYLVNRKAAQAYIRNFFPIRVQYDYYFNRTWELGIRFCGIEPRPVKQSFAFSYINSTTSVEGEKKKEETSWILWIQKHLFLSSTAICQVFHNTWQRINLWR